MKILSEFILNFCGNLDNFKEFYEKGYKLRYKLISLC